MILLRYGYLTDSLLKMVLGVLISWIKATPSNNSNKTSSPRGTFVTDFSLPDTERFFNFVTKIEPFSERTLTWKPVSVMIPDVRSGLAKA